MAKEVRRFAITVTHEDIIDVTLEFEREQGKKKLMGFAPSYRALISQRWHEVIRYDNAHGYVHVQKFWRGPKPIPLKEEVGLPLDYLVRQYKQDIVENWERYRSYVEQKIRRSP